MCSRSGTRYPFSVENALQLLENMKQLSLLAFDRLHRPGPADVTALADEIITELGLTPPIDPKVVASYLDISAIEPADIDVAGCLICDGHDITIKVRQSDDPRRQRFTVFHECSHTFFQGFEEQPRYRCAPVAIPGQDSDLESLCDQGASALLLPERFVRSDLLQADFGIDTLAQLANDYDASLEATGHRIVDAAPYPTLFVVLEEALKPSERNDSTATPKLRVRSARGCGNWPFVPKHKSAEADSPLGRALDGEIVNERATLDGIVANAVDNVEVSARLMPRQGRRRVIALFRQLHH